MSITTDSTKFINVSLKRSNIKLVVNKIDISIDTAMLWLVESLYKHRSHFPKTLVSANAITAVAKLYGYTVSELYHCKQYVEMFHSETSDKTKEKHNRLFFGKNIVQCVSCLRRMHMEWGYI